MAKMCNDVFAKQLKEQIGMNVNIKKACQTIMKYTFSPTGTLEITNISDSLIKALERISEISNKHVEFNVPIVFRVNRFIVRPLPLLSVLILEM